MIVVRQGSPITSMAQLKGKTFAFGYESSTSTHLMPLLLLSKSHLTEKDLGKAAFLGPMQDKIADAVASGEYDAGAILVNVYQRYKEKLRPLESSEPFPGAVIIAHKAAPPPGLQQVRDALLSYKPSGAETKLRFGQGVAPSTDADFNKIRFLTQVLFNKTYH